MSYRVMMLIDADNVSADVIEQAVDRVLSDHGACHVRRAYCTAEAAVTHQKLFKRLAIRPMVNLASGKNSTDIALAVDAMDLVVAERPEVVVIVSSDSDFAPLVVRLREKGCKVCGIGQEGKTGDEVVGVYDTFTDIAHRKARDLPVKLAEKAPAKRGGRKPKAETPDDAPPPRRSRSTSAAPSQQPVAAPAPAPIAPAQAAAPARRRSSRRSPEPALTSPPMQAPVQAPPPVPMRAAPRLPPSEPMYPEPPPPLLADTVDRVLAAVPELRDGLKVELGIAAERLRSAGLLAKNAPSTKLFKKYSDLFTLTPEKQPNKVQYRGPLLF